MASRIKKTKAPIKLQTIPANNKIVAEQVKAVAPSHEEIGKLAQKFWLKRGGQDGYAEQDWLRAEQELRGTAS